MKPYLKYSFLSKLPLFIIIIAILLTVALVQSFTFNEFDGINDFTVAFLTIVCTITLVLPLFGMNYRYSLTKSDIYRQVALKDRAIRIADNLIMLGVLLLSFTLTFWFLSYIIYAKDSMNNGLAYKYAYLVPEFFLSFLGIIGTYAFSYCIISISNTLIGSIILLVAVNFLVPCALSMLGQMISGDHYFMHEFTIPFIFPHFVATDLFGSELVGQEYSYIKSLFLGYEGSGYPIIGASAGLFSFISMCIIYIGVASLGITIFFVGRDPSAEWAGKPATKTPIQSILYHSSFLAILAFFGVMLVDSQPLISFIIIVLIICLYYALFGLLKMNFKMNIKEFATMGGVILGALLMGLIVYSVVKPSYY